MPAEARPASKSRRLEAKSLLGLAQRFEAGVYREAFRGTGLAALGADVAEGGGNAIR